MTIPTWAGPAVSPLWGVGGQLTLEIATGADWNTPFAVFAADGVSPLPVTNPVLEMRRDRVSTSQLIAHLDTSGQAQGRITMYGDQGHPWMLSMSAAQTSLLPTGRGFWDCFGTVNGALIPIASGVVVIKPRVTGDTGNTGMPIPTPPAPTEEVVTFPTGDEPSLAGVPDGTLWIEYTP